VLETFEKYQLNETIEAVMDSLWKIIYPILPIANPIYELYEKDNILKDWRKVIARFCVNSDYIPKTEQIIKIG
jgi:hypothetical protein